ncbi:MAG: TIGR03668 family PPOX class F420-dependent oxidoreductase [Dehalococcoidia bacterium]|nr:TIGR03668 family PPOX class F420-dependent oxidoreductase [Dehalococcoidia bacterium]
MALLASCRTGHLATVGAGGRPHLVPVCYAVVGGRIAIAVDEKPKRGGELARVRNIRRDARVTFLVDRYDDADWSRLAWLRIEGDAAVVERGALEPAVLAALRDRYPQYRAMDLESRPLILVAPRRVVAWRAAPEG